MNESCSKLVKMDQNEPNYLFFSTARYLDHTNFTQLIRIDIEKCMNKVLIPIYGPEEAISSRKYQKLLKM